MKLYVAAIHHFDPLCRSQLRQLMDHLAETEGTPPTLVATEWKEQVFNAVKAQRPRCLQLLKEQWPEAPTEILAALALTMGFEADSHVDLFPDVEMLWLEQGRQVHVETDPRLLAYAEDRRAIYVDVLGLQPTPETWNLNVISQVLWRQASAELSPSGQNRDVDMAEVLFDRLENAIGGWAIAIVGALHATKEAAIVNFAESLGVECEVQLLKPNAPLPSAGRPVRTGAEGALGEV